MKSKAFLKFLLLIFLGLFTACENRSGHIRASREYREVASMLTDAINYEMSDK
ncbi:uncharacterized protein METZ01_LOCUS327289, partial [marine metagenome]